MYARVTIDRHLRAWGGVGPCVTLQYTRRLAWGILDVVRSSICPLCGSGVFRLSVDYLYNMDDVRATTVAALLTLGAAQAVPLACYPRTGSFMPFPGFFRFHFHCPPSKAFSAKMPSLMEG